MASFTMEDYQKAYKLGKKDYQARMMRGELPTLQVLDDIMPPKGSYSEVPLGLVQIPIDQIVGTKVMAGAMLLPAILCRLKRKHRICIQMGNLKPESY